MLIGLFLTAHGRLEGVSELKEFYRMTVLLVARLPGIALIGFLCKIERDFPDGGLNFPERGRELEGLGAMLL